MTLLKKQQTFLKVKTQTKKHPIRPYQFTLLLFLLAALSTNAAKIKKECINGFSTEIAHQETTDNCTSRTLIVRTNGKNNHALSHLSIQVPCGEVTNATNSRSWPMELNNTDPTSGIYGFKIDDINNFGEESKIDSFSVTYTICSTIDSCAISLSRNSFSIAYKAGQCLFEETITPQTTLPLTANLSQSNVKCYGENTGAIHINVSGGVEPYSYLWSNGSNSRNLANISSGNYSVTITDAEGSKIDLSTSLSQPEPVTIFGEVTPTECGNSHGHINITTTGGTLPYSYIWNTGSTSEDLADLASDSYQVIVNDSNNCSETKKFFVSEITSLYGTISAEILQCHQDGQGVLEANGYGGNAPYSYLWSTGDTTSAIKNLSSGAYKVVISDSNGCSIEKTGYVSVNRLYIKSTNQAPHCNAPASGSIQIEIENGSEPYAFQWSNGATTQNQENLTSGWYYVTVTDANNCTFTRNINVPATSSLSINSTISRNDCNTTNTTADITFSGTGGTEPYNFTIDGIESESSATLPSGNTYFIEMTDANGCQTADSIAIEKFENTLNISAIHNSPSCGEYYGNATLIISGGTEPYNILWNDGSNLQSRNHLLPGDYTIQISDVNGCNQTSSFTIANPPSLPIVSISSPTINPDCNSTGNHLTARSSDDSQIVWSVTSTNSDWLITSATNETISYNSGTGEATFKISITNSENCMASDSILFSCNHNDDNSEEENPNDTTTNDNDTGTTPEEDTTENNDNNDTNPTDNTNEGDNNNETPETSECGILCFESSATQVTPLDNGCYSFTIKTSTNGACKHELSHLVIDIPEGQVTQASNTEGWNMELNSTDPKSGFKGIKLDDIFGFGKIKDDHFEIDFTVCNASPALPDNLAMVYKAGLCHFYESLSLTKSANNEDISIVAYPNPFKESVKFEVISNTSTRISLKIFDAAGNTIYKIFDGNITGEIPYTFHYSGENTNENILFFKLVSKNVTKEGKLLKIK